MFPPSDTACSDKVMGGDNFTVKEASSTTMNMCSRKTLKEEDVKEDEKANIVSPKKRGCPKSTNNREG